jgi:hypothetical protein
MARVPRSCVPGSRWRTLLVATRVAWSLCARCVARPTAVAGTAVAGTAVAVADWWREVEVNLRGPLLCARAVLPGMLGGCRSPVHRVGRHGGCSAH